MNGISVSDMQFFRKMIIGTSKTNQYIQGMVYDRYTSELLVCVRYLSEKILACSIQCGKYRFWYMNGIWKSSKSHFFKNDGIQGVIREIWYTYVLWKKALYHHIATFFRLFDKIEIFALYACSKTHMLRTWKIKNVYHHGIVPWHGGMMDIA